ncbi:MAG: glutamate--cysteine ligase [Steroidobacteraceae bacterium]|jgi:glutamate--cysteine ligase|nr:glutamate--cysteine ligase [Steroidobacteraceae bacterium]
MPATAIDRIFERRLATLVNGGGAPLLRGGLRGVEKESLRVTPDGHIAMTPHPRALGSALTNEQFTTDYSEALIELVTPTFTTNWELLQYLCDMHQFVYRHLGDERLWATSMPCRIESDESIPIAQYGPSHIGRMKTVYREGLGLRYGRVMQAISGVHFNYSFPEKFWEPYAALRERGDSRALRSAAYFDLLRNYRRHGWLVLYLFGVSPAVCSSFLRVRGETLPVVSKGTAYEPCATTLRMSDLGYRNRKQAGVSVSVNSLEAYVHDLTQAISTPYPPYEALGVNVDGKWRQLNANLLQIENEYYSNIRPKRVARSGERPTKALLRGGVEYVEVRALDVSAFDPVGVNQAKLRFLEAFLALCLLRESPPIETGEQEALDRNHVLVARRGREPGLTLQRDGRAVRLIDWAEELIDGMTGLCEVLDADDTARPYTQALALQREKLRDVARTPSARLMHELETTGESFFDLAQRMSSTHKAYFLDLYPPNAARLDEFQKGAEESLARQQAIEAADNGTFEAYLARYFAN